MRRNPNTKIVATLGPASSSKEIIEKLFLSGVDIFRLNFSHGTHQDHEERYKIIRSLEEEYNRPISVMLDLQGPKLRVGKFKEGSVELLKGHSFRFDLENISADKDRVQLPHPEIFAAIDKGDMLLVDDGKIRLQVEKCSIDFAETKVIVPGKISDHKGVNVPGAELTISVLTEKDRRDLEYGLKLDIDFIALSFVQKPEDILEAQDLIKGKAKILAKLEKPQAIQHLDEIVKLSDGILVARGDLGV